LFNMIIFLIRVDTHRGEQPKWRFCALFRTLAPENNEKARPRLIVSGPFII